MAIEHLELEQFRAYTSLRLHIPFEGIRVVGRNGSGKTTLVEALLLLSTTRSRPGSQDGDLINWESGQDLGVAPYARVAGGIARDGAEARVEVFIESNQARGTTRKLLKVSDRPRRAADVVGLLSTVVFSPEDLELVLGSPSTRRRWLDIMLSQTDRTYLRFLSRYTRILSQRNGLLKQIEPPVGARREEFDYWDEQLTALGAYIAAARARALAAVADRAVGYFRELAPGVPDLQVRYNSALQQPEEWWNVVASEESADSGAQRVGNVYERRLKDTFPSDVARGATQIGPHRDDVKLSIENRSLARFGSRGQQRLAVVALKLAEADYITAATGAHPLIILDDVLSELDPVHRHSLLDTVTQYGSQIIVTATEEDLLSGECLSGLAIARITAAGSISVD